MDETSIRKPRGRTSRDYDSQDEESLDEYDNDNDIDSNINYIEYQDIARYIHASLIGHVSEKSLTLCEFLTVNDVADILEKIEYTN